MDNIFADIPDQLPEELTTILLEHPGIRIERIISKGHCSAPEFWYQQVEHEWLILIQGQALVSYEDGIEDKSLNAGDTLLIPAGVKHRLEWTSDQPPCIWICIFYPDAQ